jgi:nucleoside-triphosphatase THEP1
MEISVYECNKGICPNIEEPEIERLLKKYQIVIIEKIGAGADSKKGKLKSPMSDVIIKNPNIVFAVHYLLKGIPEYHISANVQNQSENNQTKVFHMPMSAREIAEIFENTIEYRYKQ